MEHLQFFQGKYKTPVNISTCFMIIATSDPNAKCMQDEYECVAGDQCIPASYQCDGEIDCQDRSDEIGCGRSCLI